MTRKASRHGARTIVMKRSVAATWKMRIPARLTPMAAEDPSAFRDATRRLADDQRRIEDRQLVLRVLELVREYYTLTGSFPSVEYIHSELKGH